MAEFFLAEGRAFRGALDFHQTARTRDDEIRVGFGGGILVVIEIEHRRALVDTAGNRGHMILQHRL